jgi:hypothetical protein
MPKKGSSSGKHRLAVSGRYVSPKYGKTHPKNLDAVAPPCCAGLIRKLADVRDDGQPGSDEAGDDPPAQQARNEADCNADEDVE